MSCPDRLETQAWLDNERDDARAAKAAHHVEGCAECRELREQSAGLRDLIRRNATRHRAPASLVSRVRSTLDRASSAPVPPHRAARRRGFWFGAAAGSGITALAAGLAFLALLPPFAGSLVETVTEAHVRALISGRAIAVASSNHHTVKPWFAGRVPLSPPVADFAADGFALAGGRVENVDGFPAAVVVYRHGAHEIDLYVWTGDRRRLPTAGLYHGYRSRFWTGRDLDFAAVSDMEGAELDRFVALVKAERE